MEVRSVEEFNNIINTSTTKHICVDFYAQWCGPCKTFAPLYESWVDKYKNITLLKVDIDELEELALRYNIKKLPTFLFFESGNLEPQGEPIIGVKDGSLEFKVELLNGSMYMDDF